MSLPGHLPNGNTRSREIQHSSGCPQPVPLHNSNRVDHSALLPGTNSEGCFTPHVNCSPPNSTTVHRSTSYAFPPIPHPGEGSPESEGRQRQDNLDRPLLDGPALVPRTPISESRTPSQATQGSSIPPSAQVGNSPRQPRRAQPSRLVSVRQPPSALGASPHTLDLVARAYRPGSQAVYASHWKA